MSALALHVLLIATLLQGVQIPSPQGLVNDFAGVVGGESRARMERIAQDVRDKSGGEMAIVTIADIGDRAPSEVALQIGRQWGVGAQAEVGDARRNAGVVILVVPKETNAAQRGHCRIESGQGSEGFITDALSRRICDEAIPLFQRQEYGAAMELVTLRVAERFATEFGFALDTALRAPRVQQPAQRRRTTGIPPVFFIFLAFMVISMLSGGRRGRRGRRGGCGPGGCLVLPLPIGGGGFHHGGFGGGGSFGGGFGGGGFGGFGGGGGFSGGGGGSSW